MDLGDQNHPDLAPVSEVIVAAMDRIVARSEGRTATRSLPTGFLDLDEVAGGLPRGELIVLAGKPAMGKTALALNIVDHLICDRGKAVLYASLGMSRVALMGRMLATRSAVEGYKVRTGKGMGEEDLARLARAYDELRGAPFWIAAPPVATAARIAAGARWLKEHRDLDLVVVDDLRSVEPAGRRLSRRVRCELAAYELKDLALELDVPVLVLAGIKREKAGRSGHRPRLRDVDGPMRVAGVADLVLLLHRPEYYDLDDEPGVAEVTVARNNAGDAGRVRLTFDRRSLRFEPLRGGLDPDAVPF